jgi:hypothetical protein
MSSGNEISGSLLPALVLLAWASTGSAQGVLCELEGDTYLDLLGYAVCGAGDVNADGRVRKQQGSSWFSKAGRQASTWSSTTEPTTRGVPPLWETDGRLLDQRRGAAASTSSAKRNVR